MGGPPVQLLSITLPAHPERVNEKWTRHK